VFLPVWEIVYSPNIEVNMNSSRESMDLGISQTGKNTAYSRIRANNHIVMSEVRCSSLENVYIRVPKYFVPCLGNSQIHGFTAAVHVHLYVWAINLST
jgi:hypothetical protein